MCFQLLLPIICTQLVGLDLAQHSEHPIQQVRRTGTDGLLMVLAFMHHLIIVDRRTLRVPAL